MNSEINHSSGSIFVANCPKCNSDNIQNVQIIVQSGTTSTSSLGIGVGSSSSGGGIFGVGGSKGSQQTELAKKLAPPAQPQNIRGSKLFVIWLIGAMIVAIVGGAIPDPTISGSLMAFSWLISVVFTGIVFIVQKNSQVEPMKEYYKQMEEWTKKYFCHRCGEMFIPNSEKM